jgi:DNA-binding FadR family transcriptional regulator
LGAFGETRAPKTSELVADEIRRRIVRGELRAGDNLPVESELCETFRVSRPTLREAFRILEAEELISIRRGGRKGPTVRSPSAKVAARHVGLVLQHQGATIVDVDEAFELLLPAAARRVAQRHSAADGKALRRHVREMEGARDDFFAFLDLLTGFNYLLLELTGNKTIAVLGRLLSDIVELHITAMAEEWRAEETFRKTFVDATIKGCNRLIELIAAGDADAAEAFWARQLQKADRRAAHVEGAERILDLLR